MGSYPQKCSYEEEKMIIKQGLRSTKKNDEKVIAELEKVPNLTWAYVAGWIDGDGCISTTKDKHGYINRMIGIKLIDRDVVEWFADLFRASLRKAAEDKKDDGYNRKPMYGTTISGLRARYICEKIRPYLIEKTKNAEKFLRSFEDYPIKTVPYMQHTDEEFMAWFTAYCEAEGAFMICKSTRNLINSKGEHYKYMRPPEVKFEVVNTNESIIRYCKTRLEKMGFYTQKIGVVKEHFRFVGKKGAKDRRLYKKKAMFRLFAASANAQPLYRAMLPFMRCERKIDKVKKSLNIKYRKRRKKVSSNDRPVPVLYGN